MNDFKLTTQALCKISKIINKMGISSLIMKINIETGDESTDKQEVVKELIALVIDNLYKAEEDTIELISILKGISIEDAKNEDIISIIKVLLKNDKLKDFLKLS